MSILGIRREERNGEIWLCPTVSFGPGQYVTLEGKFASKDEMADKSAYDEDAFALKLAKRAERKRFWKNLFRKLTLKP